MVVVMVMVIVIDGHDSDSDNGCDGDDGNACYLCFSDRMLCP